TKGSLWIVFGCGGDRDKGKRPLMAQAAIELADHIVVTDDNPRSENPERIVADILCNLKRDDKVEIIHDRQAAIFSAVNRAVAEDAVLVAGKGHEDYQIVGNERLRFVDQEVVESALEAA
ncbi:MAG: UDP-N-acetylmuramoyl-L-alanyl-D-glutamate--2,6-diaminopimelate ligase, partial [Gammaproteobacteria bacterium]|nr:UDP-N-acetylmuramoyl-L-alanyl-D-glutamate--2,6-diaminopimelate ligase [Gammaproteobacteria bacterium]